MEFKKSDLNTTVFSGYRTHGCWCSVQSKCWSWYCGLHSQTIWILEGWIAISINRYWSRTFIITTLMLSILMSSWMIQFWKGLKRPTTLTSRRQRIWSYAFGEGISTRYYYVHHIQKLLMLNFPCVRILAFPNVNSLWRLEAIQLLQLYLLCSTAMSFLFQRTGLSTSKW